MKINSTGKSVFKTICYAGILLLTAHLNNGYSQMFTSDNALISVTSGAQVTVLGDVLNKNGATMTNNGTIELTGNWTNNAGNNCFGTSAGTVILNGGNQNIDGTSSTLFNNLTLLGTGTKSLMINAMTGGAAPFGGILNIGSRVFDLNTHMLTVTNPLSGAISSSTGYILSEQTNNSSKLAWNINAVTGPHSIPFGTTNGVLIPFVYNQVSGNANTITVSTYHTPPANTPLPATPVNVTNLTNLGNGSSANAADRFWQVDVSNTGSVSNLTFTIDPATETPSGSGMMLAQSWNPGASQWLTPAATQTNPNAFTTVYNNVSQYGAWALSKGASPLPIELLSFTAEAVNNISVVCKWETASEINNDFFTVERSRDGKIFEPVGKVTGAGNSSSYLNYSFNDEKPFAGISYYRLKQTDFDGNYTYSNIEAVTISNGFSPELSLYPNPASDIVNINYAVNANETLTIRISDMDGKVVFEKETTEITNKLQLHISDYAKGVYSCMLTSGGKSTVKRLVVVK